MFRYDYLECFADQPIGFPHMHLILLDSYTVSLFCFIVECHAIKYRRCYFCSSTQVFSVVAVVVVVVVVFVVLLLDESSRSSLMLSNSCSVITVTRPLEFSADNRYKIAIRKSGIFVYFQLSEMVRWQHLSLHYRFNPTHSRQDLHGDLWQWKESRAREIILISIYSGNKVVQGKRHQNRQHKQFENEIKIQCPKVDTANENQTQHKLNRGGRKIEPGTKGDSDCH